MINVVAVLEVMWDWGGHTTGAGYLGTAPRWYRINPYNHSGKRLYDWVGEHRLRVTNACPQLVNGPNSRGKPDPKWLSDNLRAMHDEAPIGLLLVCGRVAQDTYNPADVPGARIIEMPHPAARLWTRAALDSMRRAICQGRHSYRAVVKNGRLVLKTL